MGDGPTSAQELWERRRSGWLSWLASRRCLAAEWGRGLLQDSSIHTLPKRPVDSSRTSAY